MSDDGSSGYLALRTSAGLVDIAARGGVHVSGPDTWSYLQGQLSQDVATIGDGEGARSLLLTPQGKLDVDLRVLNVEGDAWLDCEAPFTARLAASLERFRLRVDVTISPRGADWVMLTVRGPEAPASTRAALGVEMPSANHAHVGWDGAHDTGPQGTLRVVRADWPGSPGVDVVGPRQHVQLVRTALEASGVGAVDASASEAVRVEAGVPVQGRDLDDGLIPQEAFLERQAVSFTKGCFLGQELVCRIDTRGHVNRYLRGVQVDGTPGVTRGASVVDSEREVGVVTSVAEVPGEGRTVALATVRREIVPPAQVLLRWAGGETLGVLSVLPEAV